MLYAAQQGVFRAYHDRVFELFWRRELDLENAAALAAVLQHCGAPTGEFVDFLDGQGRRALAEIRSRAESAGVFGVPSFLFADGDLYWGREHLPRVRERASANPACLAAPPRPLQ